MSDRNEVSLVNNERSWWLVYFSWFHLRLCLEVSCMFGEGSPKSVRWLCTHTVSSPYESTVKKQEAECPPWWLIFELPPLNLLNILNSQWAHILLTLWVSLYENGVTVILARLAAPLHRLVVELANLKRSKYGSKEFAEAWSTECQRLDTSHGGLGAVLSQEQQCKVHPIAYGCRGLRLCFPISGI